MPLSFPVESDLSASDRAQLDAIQAIPSAMWATQQTAFYHARSTYSNNRIIETDADGNILRCSGFTVPANSLSGFAKGCIFILRNAAGGTDGSYENQGTTSSCTFSLISGSGGSLFVTVATDGTGTYNTDSVADEVQINQAITAVNTAGGGTVFIKRGTYNCAANINMLAGIRLLGEGWSSLINLAGNMSLVINDDTGTQDDHTVIDSLHLDGGSNASSSYVLLIRDANLVTVRNNYITNAYDFGIYAPANTNIIMPYLEISDNYIQAMGNQDAICRGGTDSTNNSLCQDVIIRNKFIVKNMTGGGTDHNAFDFVPARRLTFTGNICQGYVAFGNEQDYHTDANISDNIIRPAIVDTLTILTIQFKGTVNPSFALKVSDNTIENGYSQMFGASAEILNNSSITDNIVTSIANQQGIWIKYCDHCTISGNVCKGPAGGTTGTGILIQNSTNTLCTTNSVSGYNNNIYDTELDATTVISNDISTNAGSSPVVGSGITFNNLGSNPQRFYAQGNVTGATTFNNQNGDVIGATLTGNITVTLPTPGSSRKGDKLKLILTQDGTGSRTVTWPSNFKKAGGALTLSTGAMRLTLSKWLMTARTSEKQREPSIKANLHLMTTGRGIFNLRRFYGSLSVGKTLQVRP